MKRIFLDANILIDYLSKGADEYDRKWAMAIIDYCDENLNSAFISSHSLMVLFHKLDNEFIDKAVLKSKISEAYELFNVIPIEEKDFVNAFESYMDDFEDAVQLSCALKVKADLLITKDTDDFFGTTLTIIPPTSSSISSDFPFPPYIRPMMTTKFTKRIKTIATGGGLLRL